MLKHDYLKDTRVTTKYGTVEIGSDGEFLGLTESQEIELSKSRDTKLIKERKKPAPATDGGKEETSTVKTTRKPRARKTTTKKE